MKTYNVKPAGGNLFIDLSEQLKLALEQRLDMLDASGQFQNHLGINFRMEFLYDECDIMISCVKSFADTDRTAALAVCKAVKIWYAMRDDDRLSVMDKFISLYKTYSDSPQTALKKDRDLGFVRLFIIEFTGILSDPKWSIIGKINYD